MEKQVHIIPKKVEEGQKYDSGLNSLVLKKAGHFNIAIKEIEDLKKQKPKAPKPITELSTKEYNNLNKTGKWNYNVDVKQYNIDIKKYDEKLKLYNERLKKFEDLNWGWQLIHTGLDPSIITHNIGFKKGIHDRISFPELLEGGGIAWLEAWHENEKPKGKSPFGLYVQAEGVPGIIRTEWTDSKYNTIASTTEVAFGSKVLLHIYTTGLYGQEVEVHLVDSDTFTPNDKLKISGADFFTREVKVHKLKPNDINKKGVSDVLTINDAPVNHAQKIELEVILDRAWIKTAGEHLKIYPLVKSIKTGTFFTDFGRSYLQVCTKKKSVLLEKQPIPATNMPLIVGDVETNVAHFQHCRYDSIKLDGVSIFDSNNIYQRITKTITVDVIAGKKKASVLDFDFDTVECENRPAKHISKELTVSSIPKDYELKIDPSSKAEHKAKKEAKELIKSESNRESSMMGMKTTQKENVAKEKGIVTVRQKQIEFDAFYNYDIPQDANAATTFYKAMKYFWLPNLGADKIYNIKAIASTCAFKQNVNIAIYPDIKWTLKFGFNVEKGDIEKLNRKGGTFAPLKTFEDKAEENDKAYFEKNKSQKETLERAEKYFTEKYNLKPKTETAAPVTKGKSFKQLLEILQRITISLEEEHYGGDIKNELTEEFVKQLYEQAKTVIDLAKIGIELLEGKHDQNNYTPEDDKNIEGLMAKLKRKTVEYEMLYPKLSFAGSWFYEQIDAKRYPELAGRQGLGVDLMLNAAPLIGVTIKWDILELLCRRHPIAYAILKAIDALLYILADDSSAIKCDFSVTGKIDSVIDLQHNMLAGFKDFNIKGKSTIQTNIILELRLNNSIKLGKFEVLVKRGLSTGASVGLGIEDVYGVDNSGIYVKKDLVFEGIKFSFEAEGSAELGKQEGKRKKSMLKLGGKITGEITMLAHTFSTDKMYINKTP
ncbi:hypothetical protein [Flavobacterium tructae]|uniref:hypothetical protein n=1 Tax=Flavobacterium tructae TaxID=1114873 RepID=UPI0035A89167